MKLPATFRYMAIGLFALPLALVYAKEGIISLDDFGNWVGADQNMLAFTTLAEDLRYLVLLVEQERPLVDVGFGVPNPRALKQTLEAVSSVFRTLHREEVKTPKDPVKALQWLKNGVPPGISTAELFPAANGEVKETFWSRELDKINDLMASFKVNLRRDVWNNRVDTDEPHPIVQQTPVEATLDLVAQLNNIKLDLADPVSVAMWTLDSMRVQNPDPQSLQVLISYNTASLTHFRAAFKSIHDGYKGIAELITSVYAGALKAYPGPENEDKLLQIETPLRELQNFLYMYVAIFE